MISVIIPVYNLEKYINHTIESVLQQTYSNFEIILVDDGSSDSSSKVCQLYVKKDPRVQLIIQPNGGVSSARNRGLEEAKGEFIAFIDGDDLVPAFYLERLISALDNTSIMAMCSYVRIRSYDYKFDESDKGFMELSAKKCAKRLLEGKFPIGVWGAIFKRKLIGNQRFPAGINRNEDKLFLYQYLLGNQKGKVSFTNQKMYGYYVREGSATQKTWNGSIDRIQVADEILRLTLQYNPAWERITQTGRLSARLKTLKEIVMSDMTSKEAREKYQSIKQQILSEQLLERAGRTLRVEYLLLKICGPAYQMLVKSYYSFVPEKMRFRRNERAIKQNVKQ